MTVQYRNSIKSDGAQFIESVKKTNPNLALTSQMNKVFVIACINIKLLKLALEKVI